LFIMWQTNNAAGFFTYSQPYFRSSII